MPLANRNWDSRNLSLVFTSTEEELRELEREHQAKQAADGDDDVAGDGFNY